MFRIATTHLACAREIATAVREAAWVVVLCLIHRPRKALR